MITLIKFWLRKLASVFPHFFKSTISELLILILRPGRIYSSLSRDNLVSSLRTLLILTQSLLPFFFYVPTKGNRLDKAESEWANRGGVERMVTRANADTTRYYQRPAATSQRVLIAPTEIACYRVNRLLRYEK